MTEIVFTQDWRMTQSNCASLPLQYNHLILLFYLAHQTVSSNTSSILVPFSWWTWCAVLHFAENGPKPGLVALKSKTHTKASVCSSP